MKRALIVLASIVAVTGLARADPLPASPFTQDPLGPLVDVTNVWTDYQPASIFCVKPDVFQATSTGPTTTGADPDCADRIGTREDRGEHAAAVQRLPPAVPRLLEDSALQ